MQYDNGDVYDGEWKNDKKSGQGRVDEEGIGVLKYGDGEKYEGQWRDDQRSGKGSLPQ